MCVSHQSPHSHTDHYKVMSTGAHLCLFGYCKPSGSSVTGPVLTVFCIDRLQECRLTIYGICILQLKADVVFLVKRVINQLGLSTFPTLALDGFTSPPIFFTSMISQSEAVRLLVVKECTA